MSQTKALYRLQKIDMGIKSLRSRLREIMAALEQDELLRQARTELTGLREALRPQEAHAADPNLELQSISEQSRQLSDRLYSGKVGNPKELQEIEGKIAELKRRHADRENELLETMMAVEDLQISLITASQRLSEAESNWAAQQKTLQDEQHRLKVELKALKAEREKSAKAIPEELLTLYQTLRATKQGHAVAVLNGEMCSYCRVSQTTTMVQRILRDQELLTCSSCGRILVAL